MFPSSGFPNMVSITQDYDASAHSLSCHFYTCLTHTDPFSYLWKWQSYSQLLCACTLPTTTELVTHTSSFKNWIKDFFHREDFPEHRTYLSLFPLCSTITLFYSLYNTQPYLKLFCVSVHSPLCISKCKEGYNKLFYTISFCHLSNYF